MAAPFVDTARITVKAGSGGNGAVAFHREKYVAAGGPDGGDGGRGGSVILEINEHMSTLMDFRYKRKYVAANGMDGQGKRCSGKDGEDLVIKVPRGTVVRDAETGEIICDMSQTDRFVLARGGNGGWGNKHFATPTRQVPRFAKAGLPGQERQVILELKLLADVGLVGFPNVGKSTFINSFAGKACAKTGNKPGVTKGNQWIRLNKTLELLDTPGILWPRFEDQQVGLKLALIGSINDQILNKDELAWELIRFLKKRYPQVLSERFGLETEGKEAAFILEEIARVRACLLKGGDLDVSRATALLLDDFRAGKLGRITLEEPENQKDKVG